MSLYWSILLCLIVKIVSATSINGRLNINLTRSLGYTTSRSAFRLYQIGGSEGLTPYKGVAHVHDIEGNFAFDSLPINQGINETTYFVLHPDSIDFNLKPNRVLIEFRKLENGTLKMNAYRNIFGKEYFPSEDIIYPDKLEKIECNPYIEFTVVSQAPLRQYFIVRNVGIFQGGPLAKFVNTPWKLAGIITMICIMAFPYIIEKLDPETAKAMKDDTQRTQREKYEIKGNE
ncbi:hypothetical protein KAFR_0F01600 [Kazachstania africana CBS 2517]|uniref:Protein SOP4 n=1 Tax=Kazachstania africana (strain ATCC 22294 / BCRC 22015 / CBS 2517 / CECT 1963 / NBRC 1671 / NRRL Y-8276) TaxID=1071382 RepID=H2AWK7_KAZAF|nr:hypothetical protein KAFR_0F01600 [Kazachstania africana CBS 2517]CCF58757.1 hypothetical protein KAFR_0F01600 [Kazachstania africana CBS 2517]